MRKHCFFEVLPMACELRLGAQSESLAVVALEKDKNGTGSPRSIRVRVSVSALSFAMQWGHTAGGTGTGAAHFYQWGLDD